MKCSKCGYDDKGTGDFAHLCSPDYVKLQAQSGRWTLEGMAYRPAGLAQEPAMLDREYTERLIAALEDNSDPVSIDAAEEFRRLLASPEPPPPECKTENEKAAYAFGWWQALKAVKATKREWVGLTHEKTRELVGSYGNDPYNLAYKTEEALREKNT